MAQECISYTSYVHSIPEEQVEKIIEEISKLAKNVRIPTKSEVVVNDNLFYTSLLHKMSKDGLHYSSKKPIDKDTFEEIFRYTPDKRASPSMPAYRGLMEYLESKRGYSAFFPPTIYTEILKLAGKIQENEDGILVHDYHNERVDSGMVVLIGCKGYRLDQADKIKMQKKQYVVTIEDYIGYNTTLVVYYKEYD